MSSVKVLHISDIHLNINALDDSVERIYKLFSDIYKQEFDHLVISGDVTDNASPDEFKLLKELLVAFRLLNPEKTTIIPGNHDIFGGVHKIEDILRLPEKWGKIDVSSAIRQFTAFFSELYEGCIFPSGQSYPFVKPLDKLVIIGLNSLMPFHYLKNPFASNGTITLEQLNWLTLTLSDFRNLPRIFTGHHHFNKINAESEHFLERMWLRLEKQTMKLYNKKQLMRIIKDLKPVAYLHGHYHVNEQYQRKDITFVNSGATIKNNQSAVFYNTLNIADNNLEVIKTRIPFLHPEREKVVFRVLMPKHIGEAETVRNY